MYGTLQTRRNEISGEIQDYFTRKMSDLIRSKGKIMIGWGEINDRHAAGPNDVLTIWRIMVWKSRRLPWNMAYLLSCVLNTVAISTGVCRKLYP